MFRSLSFGIFLILVCRLTHAESIIVAVASNFSPPFQKIVAEFQKLNGVEVKVVYGSSAKLYAQIINGAPFVLFLSADPRLNESLERQKRIVPNSRVVYAHGRLAILVGSGCQLEPLMKAINSAKKIAIANPLAAPYGRAGIDVLKTGAGYEENKNKLVYAENVAQSFHFAYSGNVDIGFVAYSQIISREIEESKFFLVPENLYKPIVQEMVLLERGNTEYLQSALKLYRFIKSTEGKNIIRRYGYQLP